MKRTTLLRPRAVATAAAALLGALALAGCNTSPGAAAVVGGQTVSVDQLAAMVTRAYSQPGAGQLGAKPDFQRNLLGRLITSQIVEAVAAQRHVTVTEAEIDQRYNELASSAGGSAQLQAQAAQSGYSPDEIRPLVRDILLSEKLADQLVAHVAVPQSQLRALYQQNIDQYDQVRSAHILVQSKALADKILAEVRKNPSSFAALAKRYSIDTGTKDNGGELGYAGHSAFVPAFSNAIFAAKPGSFIEVHSQYGWHIIHVIARRTTTFAQAEPALRRQLLSNQSNLLLTQLFDREAKRLGVHVNPRFGQWDAAKDQVVAPPDQISKPA